MSANTWVVDWPERTASRTWEVAWSWRHKGTGEKWSAVGAVGAVDMSEL
jgi:hypothetical protein